MRPFHQTAPHQGLADDGASIIARPSTTTGSRASSSASSTRTSPSRAPARRRRRARGNHVILKGPPGGTDRRAGRSTLYDRLQDGQTQPGDVDGAIRMAMQGDAASRPSARQAAACERDRHPQAHGRCPHAGAGRLYARAGTRRAGLRHRPGRHRQDLSRRRLRRPAARARRGRAHHPVAPGGRGRRAARLPARRHEGEGRSLSAARSTTRSTT